MSVLFFSLRLRFASKEERKKDLFKRTTDYDWRFNSYLKYSSYARVKILIEWAATWTEKGGEESVNGVAIGRGEPCHIQSNFRRRLIGRWRCDVCHVKKERKGHWIAKERERERKAHIKFSSIAEQWLRYKCTKQSAILMTIRSSYQSYWTMNENGYASVDDVWK